jgi:hypothetical protein
MHMRQFWKECKRELRAAGWSSCISQVAKIRCKAKNGRMSLLIFEMLALPWMGGSHHIMSLTPPLSLSLSLSSWSTPISIIC